MKAYEILQGSSGLDGLRLTHRERPEPTARQVLVRSFRAIGYGGQVALIGVVSGRDGDTNPHPLMFKAARLQGMNNMGRKTQ